METGAPVPYVKITRKRGECSSTVYLPWAAVRDRLPEDVAREALSEPGVSTAEFLDDARTLVIAVEKSADGLAVELQTEAEQAACPAPQSVW